MNYLHQEKCLHDHGACRATSPRWGDYSWAIYYGGRVYFAGEYIPYQSCTGSAFILTIGTCDGTRDGYANWGTPVNSVVP
jgi:hypothetical protein